MELAMNRLASFFLGLALLFSSQAFADNAYDFEFMGEDGKPYALSQHRGKILIVMNTATKCGFATQYKGMQKLLDKYGEEKLAVIGVSSNSFKNMEPRSNSAIRKYCTDRFGVEYPIMDKVNIGGSAQHPFYEWTASEGYKVDWNFNKIIIGKDGKIIERLGRKVKAKGSRSVETSIKQLL